MGVTPHAQTIRAFVQLAQERVANTNEIFAKFAVPHAKDSVSGGFQKASSRLLAPHVRLEAMLHAVNFDDEVPFEADEVNNVTANRVLPAEAKSAQSILAQLGPEDAFLFRGFLSQRTR